MTATPITTDAATVAAYVKIAHAAERLLETMPPLNGDSSAAAWAYTLKLALADLERDE